MLIEPSDLRGICGDHGDEDLAAIVVVALTTHEPRLLQPVHHAGDGAGGQTRHFGEPSRGHPAFQIEEIEAFEVGTRDAGGIRDSLAENRAQTRRPAHRVFQFLHQRCAHFLS